MSARILIAEDNQQISDVLATLLRDKGLQVEQAGDGVSALRSLATAPPDLLLLDLKLPGLHGIELLKKLRQSPRTRQLPVVVMTGVYRGERYAAAARELGVVAFLEKPFKAAALWQVVQAALVPDPPAATVGAPPAGAPLPAAPFDRHLLKAFQERFSGALTLSLADGVRTLVFVDGLPAFLQPGFHHRDLGAFLVRQGSLSAAEYAAYSEAGSAGSERLVQMGCLTYPDLLREQLAYLGSELVGAFALPPLPARWEQAVPASVPLLPLNLPQLLLQGYQQAYSAERSRQLLQQAGERYPAPAPDYYRHINFLSLSAAEKLAVDRMDGSRTLAACLQQEPQLVPLLQTLQGLGMLRFGNTPLTPAALPAYPIRTLFNAVASETEVELELPEETLESFADLVDAASGPQMTEAPLAAPPAPQPEATAGEDSLEQKVRQTLAGMQGKNHYEIFGMSQGRFSFDLLKKNYFAITRQFGPDVLMQLGGAEATLVEEILSLVTTAYNTLSDVVMKESYDELLGSEKVGLGHKGDDRFQAQVQAQSGKVFIEMEEWDNAEKSLQDACNFSPNDGDYLAHLAWAIYRNPKYANSRAMLDKARQMLNRALGLERTAVGFAFKGWLLLEAGQDALAEGEFNKALKLDARNSHARKGLRQLQEKREQQNKGGLFGRMFR